MNLSTLSPDEYYALAVKSLNLFVGKKVTKTHYSKRFSCLELAFEDGSLLRFDGYDFGKQIDAGILVSTVLAQEPT